MTSKLEIIQPEGWPTPRGFANGMISRGRLLHVAGQIGRHPAGDFPAGGFVGQLGQAIDNVLAIVRAAGGTPEDVAQMTIYVTDLDAYRRSLREVGVTWRSRFGRHFPAMALLGVAGLVELGALVEIEAVAVLDDDEGGA